VYPSVILCSLLAYDIPAGATAATVMKTGFGVVNGERERKTILFFVNLNLPSTIYDLKLVKVAE